MKLIQNEKVIDIIQNVLNCVDSRLINHGKRVAYLVFKILESQNKYNDKELHDICILAMLHDIGAYKTEEIDKMVEFETIDVWNHSIYGSLFLKYFSPLKEFAPVIFFHHADCRDLANLESKHRELSQIIFICDRADVFSQASNNMDNFYEHIEKFRDIKFCSDVIEMFIAANIDFKTIDESMESYEKFLHTLYNIPITEEEADAYIKMIIFSIDFRSNQTVIHTMTTVCISVILANMLGLSEEEIEKVMTGAMLHDIGKIGIPINILESPNRLTDTEMAIMKTHIDITERIIAGCVDDETLKIAVNHHEKLNGTGYTKGLKAEDISLSARIVIIADIFSALCGLRTYKSSFTKEKTIGILTDMSQQNLVDSNIASLAIENFDIIIEELKKESKPLIEIYNKINDEYEQLKEETKNKQIWGF